MSDFKYDEKVAALPRKWSKVACKECEEFIDAFMINGSVLEHPVPGYAFVFKISEKEPVFFAVGVIQLVDSAKKAFGYEEEGEAVEAPDPISENSFALIREDCKRFGAIVDIVFCPKCGNEIQIGDLNNANDSVQMNGSSDSPTRTVSVLDAYNLKDEH